MSMRVDSNQLIAGRCVVTQYPSHGVQAQNVPSTGDNGAGYLYNDIAEYSFAATDELRGQILTLPAAGTFTPYEDSSFSFTGAPDGVYTFTYRGFRNGVSYGDYTVTLTIGATSVNYDIGGTSSLALATSGSVSRNTAIGGTATLALTASGDTQRNTDVGGTSAFTVTATGDTTYEAASGNYNIGGVSSVAITAAADTQRATTAGGITSLAVSATAGTRRNTAIGGVSTLTITARANLIEGDQPRFGVIRLLPTTVRIKIRVGA